MYNSDVIGDANIVIIKAVINAVQRRFVYTLHIRRRGGHKIVAEDTACGFAFYVLLRLLSAVYCTVRSKVAL